METKRYVGNWWLSVNPDKPVGEVLEIDESSRAWSGLTGLDDNAAADQTPMVYGAADGRHITLLECRPANGGKTTIAQVMTTTQVARPRI